jgi:polyphosphate glucokinase
MKVLMIDIGGTNIKMMAAGHEGFRKVPSGERLSAAQMVKGVQTVTKDWDFEAISIGFPGPVANGMPAANPVNLGGGWVGFDFEKALKRPVRIINDAAMQALAHYETGRLLFISLGTSVGTALIADDVVIPLEAGQLRLTKSVSFADHLGKDNLEKLGRRAWEKAVWKMAGLLRHSFMADQVVIGGGNAKSLVEIPGWAAIRDNQETFRGALRLWPDADLYAEQMVTTWRIHRKPTKKRPGRSGSKSRIPKASQRK